MQYKVFRKYLTSGSAEKDKKNNYEAFSLAEMLCVLLIMSFIVIGLPAIHFKKTELKTKRSLHGRYECYYEGNQLTQYTVNEEGTAVGPTAVSECKFTPPSNAIFFLVHAVGGHHPVLAAVEQQLVSQKQLQLNIAETRQMIFRNG